MATCPNEKKCVSIDIEVGDVLLIDLEWRGVRPTCDRRDSIDDDLSVPVRRRRRFFVQRPGRRTCCDQWRNKITQIGLITTSLLSMTLETQRACVPHAEPIPLPHAVRG